MTRLALTLALVAVLLAAWMGRFDVRPNGGQWASATFVLDRWTGEIEHCELDFTSSPVFPTALCHPLDRHPLSH